MIFHWIMTGLAFVFAIGTYLDARAHVHFGFDIETFFIPSHAVMFAGWILMGGAIAIYGYIQLRKGKPQREWIPKGYGASAKLAFWVGRCRQSSQQ